jgi:ABC-type transporter Mla subunit MlaD
MIDRKRLTERVTPTLVRLELKRAVGPLVILLIGFAVAAGAGDYILSNINGGIEAGLVTAAQYEGGHAVLTVTIAKKFGNVYKNAQAELRPNTALQDMYLDVVNRGTPSAGIATSQYTIPTSQTQSPVNLADVLDLFQPDVQEQAYILLDQLGNGLAGRGGDIKQTFVDVAPFLQVVGDVSLQLALRADLTKRLVHDTSTLMAVLGTRSSQLRNIITSGTATLSALSTEGGAPLEHTIHELPLTFDALSPTLGKLDALLPSLNSAVGSLTPVVQDLPVSLKNLRQLGVGADPALRALRRPVTKLVPLADKLQPFSGRLNTSLTQISPQIDDVNDFTAAAAPCMKDLRPFADWDASMTKLFDGADLIARGNANFGFYTVTPTKQNNYVSAEPCAGNGPPLGGVPTPTYNGPAVAP